MAKFKVEVTETQFVRHVMLFELDADIAVDALAAGHNAYLAGLQPISESSDVYDSRLESVALVKDEE